MSVHLYPAVSVSLVIEGKKVALWFGAFASILQPRLPGDRCYTRSPCPIRSCSSKNACQRTHQTRTDMQLSVPRPSTSLRPSPPFLHPPLLLPHLVHMTLPSLPSVAIILLFSLTFHHPFLHLFSTSFPHHTGATLNISHFPAVSSSLSSLFHSSFLSLLLSFLLATLLFVFLTYLSLSFLFVIPFFLPFFPPFLLPPNHFLYHHCL